MTIRNWTPSQRRAFQHTTGSLLVSAAAGSGKTAVLAERCAFLVCDAPQPCDVDQLLVLTFTVAAAAEMRSRIHQALAARMEGASEKLKKRLTRQLALVEHASIDTIDGFCSRLLRQNFSAARLDPRFRMIDPDEAGLLRREVARKLLDDRYEQDASGEFTAFVDAYGQGQDSPLIDLIVKSHELLCSLKSPRHWRGTSLDRLVDSASLPLSESDFGKQLLAAVETALQRINIRLDAAIKSMAQIGGFEAYINVLKLWRLEAAGWALTLQKRGFDALAAQFHAFIPDRAPSFKADTPNKAPAKSIYDAVKDQMTKGDLKNLLAFTADQWRAGQESILPAARVLLELLEEFAGRYLAAKARLGGVDFADVERMTLNLLKDSNGAPSAIARACHREFHHVLVDEYQDVNEVQNEILRLVSAECIAEEGHFPPNLFTVGDQKQSIYRFRLADLEHFQNRDKKFRAGDPLGALIDLQENFRSRPELLSAINEIFKRLMTGGPTGINYDETHWLRAPAADPTTASAGAKPPEPTEPAVELHLLPHAPAADEDESADSRADAGSEAEDFDRAEREALLCAGLIREMKLEGRADYGDIAILLRSLQYKTAQFARILRRQGIPVHHAGGRGFFESQEVRDVLALLSLLDNQQQDIPLASLLRSPLAALPQSEDILARIRLASPPSTEGEEIPFHQAVVRYAADQIDDTAVRLAALLARLSQWRDIARRRPLADLLWKIYDDTDYLTFVAGLEDGPQRVANLLYLHQRARQFSSFLKQGLHRFMAFASELRDELDLSQPPIAGSDRQAVRIMSIHAAKGLEFPVVILPDLGKKHNLRDSAGHVLLDRKMGLGLSVVDLKKQIRYPSLSSMLISDHIKRASLAEELRLLYVAMTRAKNRLILMGTVSPAAAQKWAGEYAGMTGPLSQEMVLSAKSALDWLGPVQAMCGENVCTLVEHPADEVSGWQAGPPRRQLAARLQSLSALDPLDPPSPMTPAAAAVISRLQFAYPHQPYAILQAATSATASGDHLPLATPALELPVPAFATPTKSNSLSATQIGSATHLVLEHLDYRRPCDTADLQSQIADLLSRHFLTAAQAQSVDIEAIAWLAQTPLGQLLKKNADKIRREIPFAAAALTPSADPRDAVMIRGRIDLLVPTEGGIAIVDYKTDRVSGPVMEERAKTYLGQMGAYRDALQQVAGKTVTAIYLVFLFPRIVWEAKF